MYKGGLVTFTLRGSSSQKSISLLDIDSELTEQGLHIWYKKDHKDIGYVVDVIGISIDELMTILGYQPND